MGAIYGPHIINGAGPHLADLARLQPAVALFLDPNPDDVAAFRHVCPHTICVGRIYVPDGEVEQRIVADPEGAAAWAHALIVNHPARRQIHYWQIANEVCQFADKLPLIDRFFVRLMKLCDGTGDKCAVFGWSVGQIDMPAHDRLALWRMVYPTCAYAEAHGHIGLVHGYGAPDLWGPAAKGGAPWLINRLETQVLPILPYKQLKFVYGEYGIDGLLLIGLNRSLTELADVGVGVRTPPKPMYADSTPAAMDTRGISGPTGWQGFTDAPGYVTQLTNMGQWLAQFSQRVMGYCIFTLGNNPPWGSYDIQGEVLRRLADYYSSGQPPVDPPILPPEVPVPVKLGSYVDDFNLKIVPFEQRPDAAKWTSGPFYRIREVFTTRDGSWEPSANLGSIDQWAVDEWWSGAKWKGAGGTNNFFIMVLDKAGQPIVGKGLYWWQKGTEPANATDTKVTWDDGTENLPVWNYYNPAAGETGSWSGATVGRSDVLEGVDLPYKNHISTFVVLQESDAAIEPPPTYPTFEASVKGEAERNDVLSVNPHAALCKAGAAAGLWPTSNEYAWTYAGVNYTGQRFRNPANDAVTAFYCVTGQWSKIMRQDW